MSRNTKILVGVLAGVLVLTCLCTASVAAGIAIFAARTQTSVSVSPERVERAEVRVGGGEFSEPDGWRSDYTVRVGAIEVVGYRPVTGDGHIVLAYLGADGHINLDKLSREIEGMTGGRYTWISNEMKVIERRTVLLGDQETELVISEGRGSSGTWRQAITTYQGERGMIVAVLGLPAAQWNEQALNEFISTLHP